MFSFAQHEPLDGELVGFGRICLLDGYHRLGLRRRG
jgi:hypothetical protein